VLGSVFRHLEVEEVVLFHLSGLNEMKGLVPTKEVVVYKRAGAFVSPDRLPDVDYINFNLEVVVINVFKGEPESFREELVGDDDSAVVDAEYVADDIEETPSKDCSWIASRN